MGTLCVCVIEHTCTRPYHKCFSKSLAALTVQHIHTTYTPWSMGMNRVRKMNLHASWRSASLRAFIKNQYMTEHVKYTFRQSVNNFSLLRAHVTGSIVFFLIWGYWITHMQSSSSCSLILPTEVRRDCNRSASAGGVFVIPDWFHLCCILSQSAVFTFCTILETS